MANLRISGIMSGFDTESMIKDLMKAENTRVDKVKRNRQYTMWQQESYREIIGKLQSFQSNFFDVLKSNQNMTSASSFAKFSYEVMSAGVASNKVTVAANSDLKNKSVTIDSISQLASKDEWLGNTSNMRGINTKNFDFDAFKADIIASGKNVELTMSIGGNAKTITVDQSDLTSIDTFKDALNTSITDAFGSDYAGIVTKIGTDLKFDLPGSEIKILKFDTNVKSMTGLFGTTDFQSSYAYKNKTIGELFGLTNDTLSTISINGKDIVLDESDTISKMMNKVNASDANVNLSYDSLRDRFTLESKLEGSANNITIADGSNAETLFSALFGGVSDLVDSNGDVAGIVRTSGENALVSINGVSIVQSNNTFTLDGMNFTLNETSATAIDINVTTDTSSIVDNIKNFVKEYNDIVDFLSSKYDEKRDYDYEPLTDEEKESMTEDQIKLWETKAKSGLIKGSSEINSFLTQLRNAIIEPISGNGLTLSQIGISSTSYIDKGKLTIDETKLTTALENNYDDVVSLFTKESSIEYTDTANRATRTKENGIANRFDDILSDFVRTSRDKQGNKGILLVKAGIENDASVFNNDYQKKISNYDERISDLLEDLDSKQEYYYMMFSKMESALSQMEAQSSSLMSQLGSN